MFGGMNSVQRSSRFGPITILLVSLQNKIIQLYLADASSPQKCGLISNIYDFDKGSLWRLAKKKRSLSKYIVAASQACIKMSGRKCLILVFSKSNFSLVF